MKNLMMLAAALLVSAPAIAAGSTANVVFTVDVANTCGIGNSALPGSLGSVNANPNPAMYTALNNTQRPGVATPGFVIQCTKGTDVTITATPNNGASSTATIGGTSTPAAMNLLNVANSSELLAGLYTITVNKQPSAGQMIGDLYGGSVNYTPTANQWGARAGTYKGTLTITFEYN